MEAGNTCGSGPGKNPPAAMRGGSSIFMTEFESPCRAWARRTADRVRLLQSAFSGDDEERTQAILKEYATAFAEVPIPERERYSSALRGFLPDWPSGIATVVEVPPPPMTADDLVDGLIGAFVGLREADRNRLLRRLTSAGIRVEVRVDAPAREVAPRVQSPGELAQLLVRASPSIPPELRARLSHELRDAGFSLDREVEAPTVVPAPEPSMEDLVREVIRMAQGLPAGELRGFAQQLSDAGLGGEPVASATDGTDQNCSQGADISATSIPDMVDVKPEAVRAGPEALRRVCERVVDAALELEARAAGTLASIRRDAESRGFTVHRCCNSSFRQALQSMLLGEDPQGSDLDREIGHLRDWLGAFIELGGELPVYLAPTMKVIDPDDVERFVLTQGGRKKSGAEASWERYKLLWNHKQYSKFETSEGRGFWDVEYRDKVADCLRRKAITWPED